MKLQTDSYLIKISFFLCESGDHTDLTLKTSVILLSLHSHNNLSHCYLQYVDLHCFEVKILLQSYSFTQCTTLNKFYHVY